MAGESADHGGRGIREELKTGFSVQKRFRCRELEGRSPRKLRGVWGAAAPTRSGGPWLGRELARYFDMILRNPMVG